MYMYVPLVRDRLWMCFVHKGACAGAGVWVDRSCGQEFRDDAMVCLTRSDAPLFSVLKSKYVATKPAGGGL